MERLHFPLWAYCAKKVGEREAAILSSMPRKATQSPSGPAAIAASCPAAAWPRRESARRSAPHPGRSGDDMKNSHAPTQNGQPYRATGRAPRAGDKGFNHGPQLGHRFFPGVQAAIVSALRRHIGTKIEGGTNGGIIKFFQGKPQNMIVACQSSESVQGIRTDHRATGRECLQHAYRSGVAAGGNARQYRTRRRAPAFRRRKRALKIMDAPVSSRDGFAGLDVAGIGPRLEPRKQMGVLVPNPGVKALDYFLDPIVRGRQAVAEKENRIRGNPQLFPDGEPGPPLRFRGAEEFCIDAPKDDLGSSGGGGSRRNDGAENLVRVTRDARGLCERGAAEGKPQSPGSRQIDKDIGTPAGEDAGPRQKKLQGGVASGQKWTQTKSGFSFRMRKRPRGRSGVSPWRSRSWRSGR